MTKVLLAGATGLVGGQTLPRLIEAGFEVQTIGRRSSNIFPPRTINRVAETALWPQLISEAKPDVAISCLGTTMKAAGSREAFRAVDHDLVIAFAKAAKEAGARQMIAVSSVGAAHGNGSFYLRTKAEAEQGLRDLGFERLDLIRPGLLTGGKRCESRPGEAFAIMLSPFTDLLMLGPLRRYASTPSVKVAQAIVALAGAEASGQIIHENREIDALAG